ncbi:hypothetical protein [Archangium gephyra]|uniref:Outer membrane protein beta-barrel domain-containing protein n=1 Tax=Archangium gephyra TaxID=48 RepID=A0AAC8Q3J0_9BACT|nr:hypothetical protein [Archangium gephyra]AKJ00455.1 Hypothetical protein AA314_02081 [Archangium gephyra]
MNQYPVKTLELRLIALFAVTVLTGCATVASSGSGARPESSQSAPDAPDMASPEETPESHEEQTPGRKKKRSFYVYPTLTFGPSFGGDKFAELHYSDGTVSEITAGGSIQMGGGVLVDFTRIPLQVQTMLTWHVAGAGASNGSLNFYRWPLELLGFYKLTQNFRVGGGLQYALGPHTVLSNGSRSETLVVNYDNGLGFVAEGGFMACGKICLGFNLRFVQQSYAPRAAVFEGNSIPVEGDLVDGQHVGFNMTFGF